MEAHGGVLDCHFSWTNLVIYVFFLSWVGKMININLFRRKSSGCLTRVVHKSSWAKFNKTTTCDTTRGNKHKENTTSSRASTSRMRTAEPLTAEVGAKQSIKRQLYTTHVRAFGWEPHSSSTTTWAGKVDHELKH